MTNRRTFLEKGSHLCAGALAGGIANVQPQCPLYLSGGIYRTKQIHHGDTENTKVAQKLKSIRTVLDRTTDFRKNPAISTWERKDHGFNIERE